MRVTHNQMANAITENLFRHAESLLKAQKIVSTTKKINSPSDDPNGMVKVLAYRKTLASIDQYKTNISNGKTWIEISQTALEEIESLLGTVKQVAVDQSAGNLDTRAIALEEAKDLYDQILSLANTKCGNSYVFAGHESTTAPFSRDNDYVATYHGDDGEIKIIIGENTEARINATGEELFDSGTDVFGVLKQLIDGLETDPYDPSDVYDLIGPLNNAVTQIRESNAQIATTYTRLGLTENQLSKFKLNIENMLSDTEKADMTQAIVDLQQQEAAYEIALEVAARIIQPNLIDFL